METRNWYQSQESNVSHDSCPFDIQPYVILNNYNNNNNKSYKKNVYKYSRINRNQRVGSGSP